MYIDGEWQVVDAVNADGEQVTIKEPRVFVKQGGVAFNLCGTGVCIESDSWHSLFTVLARIAQDKDAYGALRDWDILRIIRGVPLRALEAMVRNASGLNLKQIMNHIDRLQNAGSTTCAVYDAMEELREVLKKQALIIEGIAKKQEGLVCKIQAEARHVKAISNNHVLTHTQRERSCLQKLGIDEKDWENQSAEIAEYCKIQSIKKNMFVERRAEARMAEQEKKQKGVNVLFEVDERDTSSVRSYCLSKPQRKDKRMWLRALNSGIERGHDWFNKQKKSQMRVDVNDAKFICLGSAKNWEYDFTDKDSLLKWTRETTKKKYKKEMWIKDEYLRLIVPQWGEVICSLASALTALRIAGMHHSQYTEALSNYVLDKIPFNTFESTVDTITMLDGVEFMVCIFKSLHKCV